jgi:hypothetical protein
MCRSLPARHCSSAIARADILSPAGGVTARGNEHEHIFHDDAGRFHFLELFSGLGERFGVRVHAYVLTHNHRHPLLETPEANLGRIRAVTPRDPVAERRLQAAVAPHRAAPLGAPAPLA